MPMAWPTRSQEVELGRFHEPGDEAGASLPALVAIHDVWGPSEHSRALAADLAAEGFGVLEIDLYRALGEVEIDDPGRFIRGLSDAEVLADLEAGARWLGQQPRCRGRKVGIVGVCMGGTFTLLAACLCEGFAAAAPFYGILSYEHGMLHDPEGRDRKKKPHSPLEVAERLRVPLLASFGEEDGFVPLDDVAELESALARSGQSFAVDRYAGAGHAFLNRTREEAYRPEASAAAWARIVPFLRGALDAEQRDAPDA
jgi:carboxymethylenebutenolidase